MAVGLLSYFGLTAAAASDLDERQRAWLQRVGADDAWGRLPLETYFYSLSSEITLYAGPERSDVVAEIPAVPHSIESKKDRGANLGEVTILDVRGGSMNVRIEDVEGWIDPSTVRLDGLLVVGCDEHLERVLVPGVTAAGSRAKMVLGTVEDTLRIHFLYEVYGAPESQRWFVFDVEPDSGRVVNAVPLDRDARPPVVRFLADLTSREELETLRSRLGLGRSGFVRGPEGSIKGQGFFSLLDANAKAVRIGCRWVVDSSFYGGSSPAAPDG